MGMTNDLAIKVLKRMIKKGIAYDDGYAFEPLAKDEEKACSMAIKALEQETEQEIREELNHLSTYRVPNSNTDLVSRKAVERVLNLVLRGHRDKEPKTGHWIADEVQLPDRVILNYHCSVCGRKLVGYSTETLKDAPFCHCGAKMVEPQESEDKE